MNICRKAPLQVNLFRWQHSALVSIVNYPWSSSQVQSCSHSDLHLKLGPKDGIRLNLSVYESHKGTTIHTPPLKNYTMLQYSSGIFIRAESMFICDKRTNWEVNTCMAERKGREIPNKFLVIYTAWIMFKGRITKNFVTEYQNNNKKEPEAGQRYKSITK